MPGIHLGIDCGTQSIKVLAFCEEASEVLAQAHRPLSLLPGLPAGCAEQHPEDWWSATLGALEEVCGTLGERRGRVRSMGVSGQQHGLVVLDAEDRVIRPAKLWCDTSTAAEADEILASLGGVKGAVAAIGNSIPPGFTISKILWLKKHEPAHYHRLATILLPHDFINFKLSGRKAMEWGDASGTALLDVRARTWSQRAAAAVGSEVLDMLPRLLAPAEPIGELRPELRKRLGLPAGVLIAPGGGDNMMGAIGTGNVAPGIVTASLGTSGTLYAHASEPVVDPEGTWAAFCDSTGGWLPLICTMNCTASVEHVRSLLELDHARLEALAAEAPAGCEGLMLLPWFDGERTPNLPSGTGVWFGLRETTMDRTHLARSAYEGSAIALAYGLKRLRAGGIRPREIRVTGGGGASGLWLRILSSALGAPCVPLATDEGAALGAALQGAWTRSRADGEAVELRALCERHVRLDQERRAEPRADEVALYRDAVRLFERCARDLGVAFAMHRAELNERRT